MIKNRSLFCHKVFGATLLWTFFFSLHAEENSKDAVKLQPVSVVVNTGAKQASYDKLSIGASKFQELTSHLSGRYLSFFVEDRALGSSQKLLLQFEQPDSYLDVSIDGNGFFSLPTPDKVGMKKSELVANRKPGEVLLHPIVRTIGDSASITSLGDLRIECEVTWAIEKKSVPIFVRSAFAIGGRVCHSSHIEVDFYSPKQLSSAEISENGKSLPIKIKGHGHYYAAPVYDKKWTDAASIHFGW